MSPSTGTVGTLLTIEGDGFAQVDSKVPTVRFIPAAGGDAIEATVRAFTATSLDIVVPGVDSSLSAPGTVFNISVTNPDGGRTTISEAFTMALPTLKAINGGRSGSGTTNSLFVIEGSNFGDLSEAPGAGYAVNFAEPATGNVVATASVNFTNDEWQNIFIVGTVPSTLTASSNYNVTVTTPTGTSAPLNFLVLAAVSFSPSTISWSSTSALPVAQSGFPAVIAGLGSSSYIYTFGGNTASSTTASGKNANVASVYLSQIDSATGALGAWATTTALPQARGFAAAVAASSFNSLVSGNGAVYVIGGLDTAGNPTDTVYFASLSSDGTIPGHGEAGTWKTTSALPMALSSTQALIFHGRIYIAGGNNQSGAPVANVYSARIMTNGELEPWQAHPDLPVALAHHQMLTSAGYLYVLGGTSATTDPLAASASTAAQSSIYYSKLNIRTGAPASSWTTNGTALGKAREKFSGVVAGSYVLVSGGLYNGASTGSSEQSYAQINSDGSVSSFNGATGAHTIAGSSGGYNFFNHAGAYFVDTSGKPHVLVLGGQSVNTGAPVNGVWYQH